MVDDLRKIFCEFDIGDLVRLVEDYNVDVGYGLVTDVKPNFDDVYDLEYLRVRIGTLRDIIPARSDDFFPSKPQVLVLWSGKNLVGSNKSIWMYESELTLVQKAVK
ncbi:MAG: hypothetical protein EBZ58_03080 [Bacteroidetes bacterium]|jgi:hypothetical protein|nr:hypothetical protein [Bacteroidota bacterium]